MFSKPLRHKKKNNSGLIGTIGDVTSEEVEKFGQSIASQITGSSESSDQPNPIAEAMQQKTEGDEIEKQNKLNKQRKFIRTRDELDNELMKLKQQEIEKEKARIEETERQFKIIEPGDNIQQKPVIRMSSKPKRGHMQGKPGTSKGETGPEVRKSKQ